MTGIERLRELTCDMYKSSLWSEIRSDMEHKYDTTKGDGKTINGLLSDIADQIEREQRRDPAADVSVSAYDLLPEEEREAVAWVREHGGLDEVKAHWSGRVPLSSVKRMVELHKKKRDRLKAHALWLERKCHERRERIKELERERDELRTRVMPEGTEWPRYESGEFVKFGDELEHYEQGHRFRVDVVEFMGDGWRACYENDGVRDVYRPGERVKRPTPKVLDADGAEIRVGDEVFVIETGRVHHVAAIDPVGNRFKSMEQMSGDTSWLDPVCFTHLAPVLAADGRPLREGEKPYRVDNGKQVEIRRIDPSNGESCVFVGVDGRSYGYWLRPGQLTHERPESWEWLEEDVANASCPDVYCANHHIDASDTSYEWAMARDIVRRARALAERDA